MHLDVMAETGSALHNDRYVPVTTGGSTGSRISRATDRRVVESLKQLIEGPAGFVEGAGLAACAPSLFETGDRMAGLVEQPATARRRHDQLGSSIGGIRLPVEVAECLQLVDQLGAGGQAEVGARRKLGEPDPVDAHVAPDRQVREPELRELDIAVGLGEQLGAEPLQEPDEQLTDGQSILRQGGRDRRG